MSKKAMNEEERRNSYPEFRKKVESYLTEERDSDVDGSLHYLDVYAKAFGVAVGCCLWMSKRGDWLLCMYLQFLYEVYGSAEADRMTREYNRWCKEHNKQVRAHHNW